MRDDSPARVYPWRMARSVPAALALMGCLLALTACGGGGRDTAAVTPLSSTDGLRAAFEADAGRPRLILLLSPT